uniref:Protein sprouty homolog 4-like n=1 Tax=Petromyzon marinus TaxID=7757 RepID=A0AAJ7T8B7_PETMA|nr:protein sprouty homolog 4-like [Petromyzon marinus]XP_032812249.1 protein sprouty homolog 4-like [Petromyzon marinus]XP_032812250.1 protein sprouty homolog 4-like [Petromyzon marinus]XP_032812252.1 protein sprouty homolog 4-like [Petromyzon marinus]XP_032812253.1 protein sprouty homolog 4-like [Petromyzon marinus]XP_032812254.1 protein sprouty homolog 4-like [Petromyzon marinus]
MDPRSQRGEASPLLDGTTTDGAPAPVLSLGQIRPANASNDYTDGPPGTTAGPGAGPGAGPAAARAGAPRGPLPLHQQQQQQHQHRAGSPPHKPVAPAGRVARSTSTGSTCSKSSSARTSTGSTCSEQRLLPPAPPSPPHLGPAPSPTGAPTGPPAAPDAAPAAPVVKRQPQGGEGGGGGGGGGAGGGDDDDGGGDDDGAGESGAAPAEKPGSPTNGEGGEGGARGHAACERCGKCACGECGSTRRALPACWLCEKRCLCSAGALLESCTCLCCVKALFYHCSPQTDVGDSGDSWADNPCSCRRAGCVPRWACLGALSLALPCLLCYPPGRAALKLARAAYDRLQRPGCRCRRRRNDADSDRAAPAQSPAAEKPA